MKQVQVILARVQEIKQANKDFPDPVRDWLVYSIKELAKACEKISKDMGTDYCDGKTMIAAEALNKVAGLVE
jgi:hypothetical protein